MRETLICGICGKQLGARLEQVKAHVAAHHGGTITSHEALLLRDKWEASSGPAEDRSPPR